MAKTQTYDSVGEMLDARHDVGKVAPAVATFRAAGAFRKPEGVDPKAGTRNPTNVGNPVPKGPNGSKGTCRNDVRRAKVERKLAQRKTSGKRR